MVVSPRYFSLFQQHALSFVPCSRTRRVAAQLNPPETLASADLHTFKQRQPLIFFHTCIHQIYHVADAHHTSSIACPQRFHAILLMGCITFSDACFTYRVSLSLLLLRTQSYMCGESRCSSVSLTSIY